MNPSGSFLLKRRALERAQPLSALLELTYRCNWRCVFCYNPRHGDLAGLSTAEWILVLGGLRELGTLTVTLTGGEPLLHPGFFEIAAAARARGFALRIFTNGSLVDEETAARIRALFPMAVEMSLHGPRAETHDRATAKPGSFEALWRAVAHLQEAGVPLMLKTPLTSLNEPELDDMIALARARGVRYQVDANLTPRDDGDPGPLAYAPTRDVVARLMRMPELASGLGMEERSPGGVNCGLGRITLAIDPEGNVYPCPQWRHAALGNVRQASVEALWHSSEERQRAADAARAANDRLVEEGGPMASYAFCPALAYRTTGDPLVVDERTRARAALVHELRAARG